jgi:hypothetical protein
MAKEWTKTEAFARFWSNARPREIGDCFPKENLYMRITYLN